MPSRARLLVASLLVGCGAKTSDPIPEAHVAARCIDPVCTSLPCPSTKVADVGPVWALGATRTRLFAATLDPDGHSYELERCGGALRALPDAGRDRSIATRGDDVCVGGSCDIGGVHHALGVGDAQHVSFDATTHFSSGVDSAIAAWDFGASAPRILVPGRAYALVDDGRSLYWIGRLTETGSTCAILSVDPHRSSAPIEQHAEANCGLLGMMLADDRRIFYRDDLQHVTVMDKATDTTSVITADAQTGNAIAIDDEFVYFTTIDDALGSGAGRVLRFPKSGGAPAVVASNGSQYALAVDDRYVYWATRASIFRTRTAPGP